MDLVEIHKILKYWIQSLLQRREQGSSYHLEPLSQEYPGEPRGSRPSLPTSDETSNRLNKLNRRQFETFQNTGWGSLDKCRGGGELELEHSRFTHSRPDLELGPTRSTHYLDTGRVGDLGSIMSTHRTPDIETRSPLLRRTDSHQDDYFLSEERGAHTMRVNRYVCARETNESFRMSVRSESPQPLTFNQYSEID